MTGFRSLVSAACSDFAITLKSIISVSNPGSDNGCSEACSRGGDESD